MPTSGARVAHIGVAVTDLDRALAFYREVLRAEPGPAEFADGARIVPVDLGEVTVELLVPSSPQGPVATFIAKRGPGIHHICFRVPDLEAAIRRCREHGFQLVDEQPRPGARGRRVAFIHPKATAGILLELTD